MTNLLIIMPRFSKAHHDSGHLDWPSSIDLQSLDPTMHFSTVLRAKISCLTRLLPVSPPHLHNASPPIAIRIDSISKIPTCLFLGQFGAVKLFNIDQIDHVVRGQTWIDYHFFWYKLWMGFPKVPILPPSLYRHMQQMCFYSHSQSCFWHGAFLTHR